MIFVFFKHVKHMQGIKMLFLLIHWCQKGNGQQPGGWSSSSVSSTCHSWRLYHLFPEAGLKRPWGVWGVSLLDNTVCSAAVVSWMGLVHIFVEPKHNSHKIHRRDRSSASSTENLMVSTIRTEACVDQPMVWNILLSYTCSCSDLEQIIAPWPFHKAFCLHL